MLDLGKDGPPSYNFDDAYSFCLDALLADEDLEAFDANDPKPIAWDAPHSFKAWPDVRQGLKELRKLYPVVSFTLLSYRLVIDSSRANDLDCDTILSCESPCVQKLLPKAYRSAASMLQFEPEECLMVACHPFDLDAVRAVEFRTALVRRPEEWGDASQDQSKYPRIGTYNVEVDSFVELAGAIRCQCDLVMPR